MGVRVAVIGSGIAGLSAVRQLLQRGLQVVVYDGGEHLDRQRQEAADRMASVSPWSWNPDDLALIEKNESAGGRGLPKKNCFGSGFVYAKDRPHSPMDVHKNGRVAPFPTFASGGFSIVWGGAMLPADDCDMADWPVRRSELEPYFRQVLAHMPLTGDSDGTLGNAFPTYGVQPSHLDCGAQGRDALADLIQIKDRLKSKGLLVGAARLAIHTGDDPAACRQCGYCFVGCPYGSIYSTLPEINLLAANNSIQYRPGTIVSTVTETSDGVSLELTDSQSGTRSRDHVQAVFLAAGPINTTRILLASQQLFDQPVTLKESQKFVVPILRIRDCPDALNQDRSTQPSAFIEARLPRLSPHWVHIQLTAINDLMTKALRLQPILDHPLGRALLGPFARRLMVGWSGMHSDHSSSLVLQLLSAQRNGNNILEINPIINHTARAFARRTIRAMMAPLASAGLMAVPLLQFSNPGSGSHCGSSFPMKKRPNDRFDTDSLGRPFGCSRVFAVDASVLPSIPGTTLVINVAANSARIADTAPI